MKPAKITLHKTDAMTELQLLVSRGYYRYCTGIIPQKSAQALTLRFSDRYQINATTMQRYRAKKKGIANAALVLLQEKGSDNVFWWLLATEGEGLVHQLEKLQDASDKRQRVTMPQSDYELVKVPRKELKPAWTWRMTPETEEAWGARFKNAIQHNNDLELRQALESLRRVPGFREARKQAFAIESNAVGQWARLRHGEWPYPRIFVGFKGRFKTAEKKEVSC